MRVPEEKAKKPRRPVPMSAWAAERFLRTVGLDQVDTGPLPYVYARAFLRSHPNRHKGSHKQRAAVERAASTLRTAGKL